ncbi:MAG: RDD family protein [Acidothermaceae bacterium]
MFPVRYDDDAVGPAATESDAKAIVTGVGRVSGSWLEGPGAALRSDDDPAAYPGKRLGLPPTGTGAVAGFGRRLGALVVDWIICLLVASAFTRHAAFDGRDPMNPGWPVLVLAVEYIALLASVGTTLGMRVFSIGVRRLDGGRVSLLWVAVRTIMLLLVVPAVVYDRDQRGLHDRAAGAIAVRI